MRVGARPAAVGAVDYASPTAESTRVMNDMEIPVTFVTVAGRPTSGERERVTPADERRTEGSTSREMSEGSESDGSEMSTGELAELLHAAATAGDAESVKSLLPYLDGSPNVANCQGASPLHSAVFNGHVECVQALIDAKAEIDVVEERGCTPLFLAAQSGHAAVAAMLMRYGASVSSTCALGSTPLMAAVQNGWPAVVCVLKQISEDETSDADVEAARSIAASGDLSQVIGTVPEEFLEQARHMPLPLRRLIVCGAPPSDVTAAAVVHALRLPLSQYRSALAALVPGCADGAERSLLLRQPGVLSATACKRLREAVDSSAATNADSVDGLADHQLDLRSLAELEELIGAEALARLKALPAAFYAGSGTGSGRWLTVSQTFIRRYAAAGRPWFTFHRDKGPLTVNVALADDACHRGGRLLGLVEGEVRVIERCEGEATVHPSTLLHGVSRTLPGGKCEARYALIVFYRDEASGRKVE